MSYRFGVIAAYCSNFEHFAFFSHPLAGGGGIGTTYDVHLGLLIELFSLGVTAESLRAKRVRKSAISLWSGPFVPKFQVEGVAPTSHFCTDS